MADGVDERVVTAALLAHELEQFVGQRHIKVRADLKRRRLSIANAQEVLAGLSDGGEVSFDVVLKLSPATGDRFCRSVKHDATCPGVYETECLRQGRVGESNCDLWSCGLIADLIDADEDLRTRIW